MFRLLGLGLGVAGAWLPIPVGACPYSMAAHQERLNRKASWVYMDIFGYMDRSKT